MTDSTSLAFPRRTLILGTAAVPLLAACSPLGATSGSSPSPAPSQSGATGPASTIRGTLASKAIGGNRKWIIYYPPGSKPGDPLPVAIMMHGLGDGLGNVENKVYQLALADLVSTGAPGFAVAAIEGGSYFWQKSGKRDGGALIASEFLGLLAGRGLDTTRLALSGWSMGGWGALELASGRLQGKLRAIAPLSTPCYPSWGAVPDKTWMTKAAFTQNNFYSRTAQLAGLPIYLACGKQDDFFPGNVAFAAKLKKTPGVTNLTTSFRPGGHNQDYWLSQTSNVINFLGPWLTR